MIVHTFNPITWAAGRANLWFKASLACIVQVNQDYVERDPVLQEHKQKRIKSRQLS